MKYADIVASLNSYASNENGSSFVSVEKAKLARFAEYMEACEVTEPKTTRDLIYDLIGNVGAAAAEFVRVANRENGVSCQNALSRYFGVNCGNQKNCDACRAATLNSIFDSLRDIEATLKEDE